MVKRRTSKHSVHRAAVCVMTGILFCFPFSVQRNCSPVHITSSVVWRYLYTIPVTRFGNYDGSKHNHGECIFSISLSFSALSDIKSNWSSWEASSFKFLDFRPKNLQSSILRNFTLMGFWVWMWKCLLSVHLFLLAAHKFERRTAVKLSCCL